MAPALRSTVILLTLSVVITSGIVQPAVSTNQFSISVDPSIETPTRSISFLGNSFDINEFAQRDPGTMLGVSVSGPSESYVLYLYNSNKQAVHTESSSGNDQFSIDLTDRPPGSYAVVLFSQRSQEFETIYPIVVRGYDVSLTITDDAITGSEIHPTVSVKKIAGTKSIESVEVALVNDTHTTRVEASKTSDRTYEATLSLDEVDMGTYRAYAAVRGSKEAFGTKERLGVSDQQTLRVEAVQSQTPTEGETTEAEETETEPNDGVPLRDGETEHPPTAEPTEPKVVEKQGDPDGTESSRSSPETPSEFPIRSRGTSDSNSSNGTLTNNDLSGMSVTDSRENTQSNVITPSVPTATESLSRTDSPGQSGLGLPIVVITFIFILILAHRYP